MSPLFLLLLLLAVISSPCISYSLPTQCLYDCGRRTAKQYIRAPSQYPIRRLIVRSRGVSKPRDLYLELSDRSDIWQAHRQQCCRRVCQISKRYDNLKYYHAYPATIKNGWSPDQCDSSLLLTSYGQEPFVIMIKIDAYNVNRSSLCNTTGTFTFKYLTIYGENSVSMSYCYPYIRSRPGSRLIRHYVHKLYFVDNGDSYKNHKASLGSSSHDAQVIFIFNTYQLCGPGIYI